MLHMHAECDLNLIKGWGVERFDRHIDRFDRLRIAAAGELYSRAILLCSGSTDGRLRVILPAHPAQVPGMPRMILKLYVSPC